MNKIIKNTILLFAITLVSGVLLGTVYEVTKEPRAKQEDIAKTKAYKKVFKDAHSFDEYEYDKDAVADALNEGGYDDKTAVIDDIVEAKSKDGDSLGYVITVTDKDGYGGDITFTLGINNEGNINGIAFLKLEETAGMGMKADEDSFKNQFTDKNVSDYNTESDSFASNGIDAISGATITTKAVSNGVNAGVICFKNISGGGTDE